MIFDLPHTTTREIATALVRVRDTGNQNTTSRVLTLIVVAEESDNIDFITDATNNASREHPSRVIVLITGNPDDETSLDAEIRIGGDAGASEVILIRLHGEVTNHLVHVVTPLLLPDTPIVAWWPFAAPVNPSEDPIGRIAQRRITDSQFDPPVDSLYNRRSSYTGGDSDLAWARLTPWRGVLASALDQPPHEEIKEVKVYGPANSPSVDLAAGWLADRLSVPVTRVATPNRPAKERNSTPVSRVELYRANGCLTLEALEDNQTIAVTFPEREPARVAVNLRTAADCLAEELRHLDPDAAYERALEGMPKVHYPTV